MTHKKGCINKIKIVFIFCLGAILVGCVSATSKQMTANFGEAAKAISLQTELTLKGVRVADSNFLVSTALTDNSAVLELPAISPEDIALRLTLLSEITKYSDALLIMSSDVELERIDTASRELYGALGALNQTIQQTTNSAEPLLAGNDLQLVATAVNIAGRWFFERARLDAIKISVTKANPVIKKAIELLRTEIKKDGAWSKSLKLSLESDAKNLFKVAQSIKKRESRRTLLAEAYQLFDQASFVDGTFKRLNSSLEELKVSHSALSDALQNDSDVNIKKALSSLSKLESEITRIYAFQASLAENGK